MTHKFTMALMSDASTVTLSDCRMTHAMGFETVFKPRIMMPRPSMATENKNLV